MPVWKYRSVEEMPDAWEMKRGLDLGRRIRAVLSMGRIIEPLNMPRGVHKFRSFEDLVADRERYEQERIERIRARNERK
jgi:hypothetical protein